MRNAGPNLYEGFSSQNCDDDTDVGRLGSAIDDEVGKSASYVVPW
jgi:hypothetical protein